MDNQEAQVDNQEDQTEKLEDNGDTGSAADAILRDLSAGEESAGEGEDQQEGQEDAPSEEEDKQEDAPQDNSEEERLRARIEELERRERELEARERKIQEQSQKESDPLESLELNVDTHEFESQGDNLLQKDIATLKKLVLDQHKKIAELSGTAETVNEFRTQAETVRRERLAGKLATSIDKHLPTLEQYGIKQEEVAKAIGKHGRAFIGDNGEPDPDIAWSSVMLEPSLRNKILSNKTTPRAPKSRRSAASAGGDPKGMTREEQILKELKGE